MALSITSGDLVLRDDEPRVLDLKLAEALGFAQPRDVRKLIDRNKGELDSYGDICATVAQNTDPKGRGRPGLEYWLNEAQALLVCMFSRTGEAARVRREIVEVFMAWRRGKLGGSQRLAPVGFPEGDEAISVLMAKLALLREARMTHGPRAAARLWPALGLPAVNESMVTEADDGRACLSHLMAVSLVEDDPGSSFTVGRQIGAAFDGDAGPVANLAEKGLRVVAGGVHVANWSPFLDGVFRDTRWRKNWRKALRRLPGAEASGAQRYGHVTQRGTFLPEALVDDLWPG